MQPITTTDSPATIGPYSQGNPGLWPSIRPPVYL